MTLPKFGLVLPNIACGKNEKPTLKWLTEYSVRCESEGVKSIWLMDHVYWHNHSVEQIISLACIASATSNIHIGSCILQLPLRHNSLGILGKQLSNIYETAGDRLVVGLGMGSVKLEYEKMGFDFDTRSSLFENDFIELKKLLSEGFEAGQESSGEDTGLAVSQVNIPFWFGSRCGSKALRRAAKYANGWMPLFIDRKKYEDSREKINSTMMQEFGRTDSMNYGMSLLINSGDKEQIELNSERFSNLFGLPYELFSKYVITGSMKYCAEKVNEFLELGLDHVSMMWSKEDSIDEFLEMQSLLESYL